MTLYQRSRSHEAATIDAFRDDPDYAAAYINAVLEDGDQDELLLALRRMAAAFGGVPAIAELAKLNATSLYRVLSAKGNPELRTLSAILKAMGMRVAIQPLKRTKIRAKVT
jgi:probable addiction module antidote protein